MVKNQEPETAAEDPLIRAVHRHYDVVESYHTYFFIPKSPDIPEFKVPSFLWRAYCFSLLQCSE